MPFPSTQIAMVETHSTPYLPPSSKFDTFRTSVVIPAFGSNSIKVETVNGLPHVHAKLDSKSYQSLAFASQLFSIITTLHLLGWHEANLSPSSISVRKASGSLTNAVYFVSSHSSPSVPTYLLRIYGASSHSLISRSHELRTLHVLSSRYHIGPRIYGTFTNGRVEEYFDSVALVPSDVRDKTISRWIGARMAELHSVKISDIEGPLAISSQEGRSWDIGVRKRIKAWLPVARTVLAHPNMKEDDRVFLDMDTFSGYWARYMRWITYIEKVEGACPRVFAHNDAHYNNLLRLTGGIANGTPEHHQIVVVDFEYAAPNPLAFDIANHFHEWTADYCSSTPHLLKISLYPTVEERRNFYEAYLSRANTTDPAPAVVSDASLARLERQVRIWSPASHGIWAVWGIVQAKEDIERGRGEGELEFDHFAYAKCRMEAFFCELRELGL